MYVILLPLLHKFLKSTVLYILLHFLLHRACQVVRLKWALQKLVNALKRNSTSFKIKAWENLHRSANASQIATRHKLCAAVNGRKPAMRVSERVRPTADLTPAPHKMCNKLLKFASYRCCCRCGLLN